MKLSSSWAGLFLVASSTLSIVLADTGSLRGSLSNDISTFDGHNGDDHVDLLRQQEPEQAPTPPRSLMEDTNVMSHGSDHTASFLSLPCNSVFHDATSAPSCSLWSEVFPASTLAGLTGPAKIDCGTCVKLDGVTGTISIPTGLNVEGKLVIDSADYASGGGSGVEIVTPFVLVQGIVEISSDRPVSPDDDTELVRFTLDDSTVGGADLVVSDHIHEHNSMFCDMHNCAVGTKPIVIAGGKMDVHALPADCPSWVRLDDVETRPVTVPEAGTYATPAALSSDQIAAACPTNPTDPTLAGTVIENSFDSDAELGHGLGLWNGHWATYARDTVDSHTPNDPYLRVSNRAVWQGPMMQVDDIVRCMVPGEPYIMTAKIKLDVTADFVPDEGLSSTKCVAMGTNCPQAVLFGERLDGTKFWRGLSNHGTDIDAIEDNVWYEYTTIYRFSEDDLAEGNARRLYFDGPERGVDILVDDVKLGPVPAELYPEHANPGGQADMCSQLIINGDAESGGNLAFPFYANSKIDIVTEDDGNTFFRNSRRSATWHGLQYKITPSCVTEGDIYTFSSKFRVDTNVDQPVQIKIQIKSSIDGAGAWNTVKICPAQTSADGWVDCAAELTFNEQQSLSDEVELYFEIWAVGTNGDLAQLDYSKTAVVDFDDISATFVKGPVTSLIVPAEVSPCWGNGSEVLVTSHTIKYDDQNVRSITSSEPASRPGLTRLVLDSPVPPSVTTKAHEQANPHTVRAVEIALLSRNAVFTAATTEGDKKSGGHVIIFHTASPQLIEGVEINNFGQAGNLGRYPLHFHMCGSSEGSVVSKNLVRESLQRCYVLHGTHNVTLDSNAAFDTFGHCFFLEDGAEEDNVMRHNLGALTKAQPPQDMISEDETDDEPATFWLTNPVNTWEGNVAAGSERSGFWFEMREHVRGPSQMLHPQKRPKYLQLKKFNNNVAHSNNEHGLKTYPGAGYAPTGEQAVFANMASYRNRGDGVFFHNSRNLAVVGGFMSDNRIQVDFDRVTTTRVSDATITGYSPLYKSVVGTEGNNWYHRHCPSSDALVGVQLHTYWNGEGDARGFVVENTSFEHLGQGSTCDGSHAINVDNYEDRGYFDIRTRVSGLSFDADTAPFEFCSAKYDGVGGIDTIAIRDLDGSLSTGSGSESYILSDSDRMTSLLADGSCTALPDTCAVECPGLCLRSKYFKISSLVPSTTQLQVVDTVTGKSVKVYGYFDRMEENDEDRKTYHHRTFHVALPEQGGPFTATFIDADGTAIWPTYVEEVNDDTPGNCGTIDPVITVVEPPAPEGFCNELIVNGDMSNGDEGWLHNEGGLDLHEEGVDGLGDSALKSDSRTGTWNGVAQFLDTRCLVEGEVYEFQAQLKMEGADGTDPGCDVWTNTGCPAVYLRYETAGGDAHYVNIFDGPTVNGDWATGEWNEVRGLLTVTPDMAENAESALIYVNGASVGINIIVDNVSMTPYVEEPVVCSDVVIDEDFSSSFGGWEGNGSPYALDTADSHSPDNQYFYVQGRPQASHGPLVEIDVGCMSPGLYLLTAKLKVHRNGDFAGTASNCQLNDDGCTGVTYYYRDSNDESFWKGFTTVTPYSTTDEEWTDFAAFYTFTEHDVAPGNAHRIYFNGPEANVEIMVDDIRLARAPAELSSDVSTCDNDLIINGDAELSLLPFTQPFSTNAWKTKLITESEADNQYFSIKNRWGNWHGAQYLLPTSCLTEGDTYTFSARFRIHSSTPSHVKVVVFSQADPTVDADKSWDVLVDCPTQTDSDGWVDCAALHTITAHQGSSGLVKFQLEVHEDIYAVVDSDDFSFVPYVEEATVCSDVVLSEDFSSPLSRSIWWGNGNSGGNALLTTDSHTPGDQYFSVQGRTGTWNGPIIDLDMSCITPGLYFFTAKIKLHLSELFTGTSSNCAANNQNCVQAVYYRRDATDQAHYRVPSTVSPIQINDEEWFDFGAYYTFKEEDLFPGNVHRLYFEGPEANIDIQIDDVKIIRAPAEVTTPPSTCDDLIVNGNAELAPAPFTQPFSTNAWKTKLIVEEESGNNYFSIKGRWGNWHGLQYHLPVACVNESVPHTFSAKIRIHSTTPSHAKIIMFAQTDPNVNADKTWSLLGHCPTQTINDGWVQCTLTYSFTAHQAQAGLVKFYFEVPEDINAVTDYDDFSFTPN